MKIIRVRKELYDVEYPSMEEISARLDKRGKGHLIGTINWKEFPYKPYIRFKIAYSDREIFLKYYVKEKYFKAEQTETNQRVYEDSCVEFFTSPVGDLTYYNFEFNAIGTCLLGTGTGRGDRTLAPADVISTIRRLTSIGSKPVSERDTETYWTITIAIPVKVFFHHDINDLEGKTFGANFYKCGDKLSVPHYLTWNRVATKSPDFHQSQYFGQLRFMNDNPH
jgi:hypothetical protein